LLWQQAKNEPEGLSKELSDELWRLRHAADAYAVIRDRAKIFEWQRKVRLDMHAWLNDHFKNHGRGENDARVLGLNPGHGFEVHSARFAMRVGPDGQVLSQAIVGLLQRDANRSIGRLAFEGGSTVIADLATRQIRYIIRKNALSEVRFEQQKGYAKEAVMRGRASTYFGPSDDEPFAALHQPRGGK
jgi:hypothetical protein